MHKEAAVMRSTIEIDERLIEKAMKLTKAKTKKEVVNISLEHLVMEKRRERLKEKLGNFPLKLTQKDLEKLRENS